MQVKLAPFLQAFAGFALRSGRDDLYLHVPLYAKMVHSAERCAHGHIHLVVYRNRELLSLSLAVFRKDTQLVEVGASDWQHFGPFSEADWFTSGAETAVEAVLVSMREQLGGQGGADTTFLIPSRQFPQIFSGLPVNLEGAGAADRTLRLNLCGAL